jgi:hypothetical protein
MLARVEQKPAQIAPSSSAPELMKDSEQEELDTITLSQCIRPRRSLRRPLQRLRPHLERKT